MAADLARAVDLIKHGEALAGAGILETARAAGMELPLETILVCGQGFLAYGYPVQAATWLERGVQQAAGRVTSEQLNEALGWLGLACLEAGKEDQAAAIATLTQREDGRTALGLLLFRARWLVARGERAAAGALYAEGLTGNELATPVRVILLLERGHWLYAGGDFAAAGRDWQRAMQLAGLLGDPVLLTWCRRLSRGDGLRQVGVVQRDQTRTTIPHLYFRLLGEFAVWRDQVQLDTSAWPRRKAVTLLQYLALQPHWRAGRDEVTELFWGAEAGSGALHVTLHALRQALGAGIVPAPPYVKVRGGFIGLTPELVAGSDWQQFRACIHAGRAHWESDRAQALECYRQARNLYSGELLAGAAEENWLAGLRENSRQLYLEALTRLAAAEIAHSAAAALDLWLEVLAVDPGREEAVAAAMELGARTGRMNQALECYRRYARYAAQELGLRPAPALQRLYGRLREVAGGETDGRQCTPEGAVTTARRRRQ